MPPPTPPASRIGWIRRSLSFRAVVVAILILLLLIPLEMVNGLIRERSWRMEEAETSISGDWGRAQTITGPVIDVPFNVPVRVQNSAVAGGFETRMETRYAHFLPERLDIEAQLEPFQKYRGIYKVAVYGSRTTLKGNFAPLGNTPNASVASRKMCL